MKTIKFTSLSIRNFKGLKHFELSEFSDVVNIFGANATGKTTLWDAANWLLFGKDSQNRQDFNIRPLNKDGTPKRKMDIEVKGVLLVSDKKVTLRRIHQEIWRKKRGAEEAVYDGNTTIYEIDDVPKQKKEYDDFINDLCPENLFRLITSPSYFPAMMKWQDQREMLFKIAGELSDEEIAEGNEKFQALMDRASGKTFEEYKSMINGKKKKIKEQLNDIPARIDEVDRGMPEANDWKSIQEELDGHQKAFDKLSAEIEDKSKMTEAEQERRITLGNELYAEKQKMDLMRHELTTKENKEIADYDLAKRGLNTQIDRLNRLKEGIVQDIKDVEDDIAKKEKTRKELREQWTSEDTKVLGFSEDEFVCPTCDRKFEDADIEEKKAELTARFNTNKAETLKDISERGKKLAESIKSLQAQVDKKKKELGNAQETIKATGAQLAELKEPTKTVRISLDDNPEYAKSLERIDAINQELAKPQTTPEIGLLKDRKRELSESIDWCKSLLHDKETIEKANARIAELEAEQKKLAQELASLEKEEFIMQEFTYAKINAVEKKVNSMFSLAEFKLFDTLVDGREVETCVAMYEGVPYPDVNDAMKIGLGLDIINTLSEYHGVRAPVWIDNRESTVSIPSIDTQVINLYVSAGDEKLRIETN